jgi:hypothetical protein
MAIADRSIKTRTVTVEDAVRNLQATLTRFERLYEMTSEEMLEAVQTGTRNDTAEIARWMVLYREFQYLTA